MIYRYLISFSIIGGATYLVLYLFTNYTLTHRLATSTVVGVAYVILVSVIGGRAFYKRLLAKMLENQKEKGTKD